LHRTAPSLQAAKERERGISEFFIYMETLRNDLLSTLISLCCQLKSNPFYWPWWLVRHLMLCLQACSEEWVVFITVGGNGFYKVEFPSCLLGGSFALLSGNLILRCGFCNFIVRIP
jgi:hypothetical protein